MFPRLCKVDRGCAATWAFTPPGGSILVAPKSGLLWGVATMHQKPTTPHKNDTLNQYIDDARANNVRQPGWFHLLVWPGWHANSLLGATTSKGHVAASCCKAGWFEMFPRLQGRQGMCTAPRSTLLCKAVFWLNMIKPTCFAPQEAATCCLRLQTPRLCQVDRGL